MMMFLLMSILKASPIVPKNSGDESYSESYTAFADLDDGTYILIQLLFSNAGVGSNKAVCRLLHVPKGKKGVNSSIQASKNEWKANPSKLQVQQCYIHKQEDTTIMYGKTDIGSVMLTFDQKMQKQSLKDGRIQPKSTSFYEQDILIMTAKVQAKISIGAQQKTLSGYAQLDHSRSNALLPDVAKGWYRFRGFRGSQPVFAQLRIAPNGEKTGWVYDKTSSKEYALQGANTGTDSVLFTELGGLVLSPVNIIYEYRPLESYGMLGSLAKAWIGNPVTRTYRGMTNFQGEEILGILEIVQLE